MGIIRSAGVYDHIYLINRFPIKGRRGARRRPHQFLNRSTAIWFPQTFFLGEVPQEEEV